VYALLLCQATAAGTHVLTEGALRVEIETATDFLAAEFGPRFDRTALVRSVQVDGVELLGPWGLPDEFGLYGDGVLGYESASPGDEFVKIGIGTLTRDTPGDYHFSHPYPLATLFPVEVKVEADGRALTVRQRAATATPYRYDYSKTYTVSADHELTIQYRLTNTGTSAWSFEHYNHHWFRPSDTEIGPGYRVVTGFLLPEIPTKFLLEPSSLRLAAPLGPGEAAWYGSDLEHSGSSRNTFELSVDGVVKVLYEGTFVPARFALYASEQGFCPEVFKRAVLQPGESVSWTVTYRFLPVHRDSGEAS
jgi:hypothetical protein